MFLRKLFPKIENNQEVLKIIAFGLFLILAAYAYHIFKKPHPLSEYKTETVSSKSIENEFNKEIIEKNNLIEKKIKNYN